MGAHFIWANFHSDNNPIIIYFVPCPTCMLVHLLIRGFCLLCVPVHQWWGPLSAGERSHHDSDFDGIIKHQCFFYPVQVSTCSFKKNLGPHQFIKRQRIERSTCDPHIYKILSPVDQSNLLIHDLKFNGFIRQHF